MISEAEEIEGEVLKEEVFLTRVVESEKSIFHYQPSISLYIKPHSSSIDMRTCCASYLSNLLNNAVILPESSRHTIRQCDNRAVFPL